MKAFIFPMFLFVLFVAGCAHRPAPVALPTPSAAPPQTRQGALVSEAAKLPPPTLPAAPVIPETNSSDEYGDIEVITKVENGKGEIADPLEPVNRVMYNFNDKLYFWLLKPVAQGYGKIVPEPARISVGNFFTNLTFPIRFVNCLLQANFKGAASEFGRFTINTFWGIGGFLDPASNKDFNLPQQDEDFGQTLGTYGLDQGFFIMWPFFGPSSPRDTVGLFGDAFLAPPSYLNSPYAGTGAKVYERVNSTSLKIGDYESLKEAAIDPYVSIRDAYVQYRLEKVKRKGGNTPPADSGLPKNE